jgi:hypothetical protein
MQWRFLGFWGNDKVGLGSRINVVAMLFQAAFQNAEAGPLPYMHASTLTFTPILVRLNPSLSLYSVPLSLSQLLRCSCLRIC